MKGLIDMLKGRDGQWSLRRILAVYFSWLFSYIAIKEMGADKLLIIGGLITAMLGLTTLQNIKKEAHETPQDEAPH